MLFPEIGVLLLGSGFVGLAGLRRLKYRIQ